MRTSSPPLVHLALDFGTGTFERRQKRLQPRQAGAFLGQAEALELVQNIAGLLPEPGDHPAAHAVAAEHARIELEHRPERRLVGPFFQLRGDGLQLRFRLGLLPQRRQQRLPLRSPRRELEQRLLADAENRAAQHCGERQIVLGLDEKAAERGKILDRDVAGQAQPVGAGYRHALFLEASGQRMHEAVALAHQHHHVARAQPSALAFDDLARIEPLPDGRGHGFGDTHCRRPGMVDRLRPVVRLVDGIGAERRPQLDIAGFPVADGVMAHGIGIMADAAPRLVAGKDQVDGMQHVIGRAEGERQPHPLEAGIRLMDAARELDAWSRRRIPAPHPGRSRSTAFRRQRQRPCG